MNQCDMCFGKEQLVEIAENIAVCVQCYEELSQVYFIDEDEK